jgi:hypothetical protein
MAKYADGSGNYSGDSGIGGGQFVIGRVKNIVLGEYRYDGVKDPDYETPRDIGKISYEVMYSALTFPDEKGSGQPAYPIFSTIKQYPLLSEIVLIVPGPDADMNDDIKRQGMYYFPPFSLWSSVNHNAFPNMEEYSKYLKHAFDTIQQENKEVNAESVGVLPIGYMFTELKDIRSLRPFEGDTIIESRFGQSIRFGSTNLTNTMNNWSKSGALNRPITIIRNGQGPQDNPNYFVPTVENINRDNATMWMTSGQSIDIDNIGLYPFNSFGELNKVPEKNVSTVQRIDRSRETTSAANQDTITLRR